MAINAELPPTRTAVRKNVKFTTENYPLHLKIETVEIVVELNNNRGTIRAIHAKIESRGKISVIRGKVGQNVER